MATFGQRLRHERERRNTPLEDISRTTQIGIHYLEALERNEFEALPGPLAFGKLYIRAYARILGFDPRPLIAEYDEERYRRIRRARAAGPHAPSEYADDDAPPIDPLATSPAVPAVDARGEFAEPAASRENPEARAALDEPAPALETAATGPLTTDEFAQADAAEPIPAAADERIETRAAPDGPARPPELDGTESVPLEQPLEVDELERARPRDHAAPPAPGAAAGTILQHPVVDRLRRRIAATSPRTRWIAGALLALLGAVIVLVLSGAFAPADEAPRPLSEPPATVAPSEGAASTAATPTDVTEGENATAARAAAPPAVEPPPVEAPAVGGSHLRVTDFGIGRGVRNHQLTGEATEFREGQVVWFSTRVLGGRKGETLRHVWLRDGGWVQTVNLPLGGPHWRTQSRKTLWGTGRWTVEARDVDGNVLARAAFTCLPRDN